MNVPLRTIVTATPYVPTLKGPTSVGVSKVLRAMEETAQVKLLVSEPVSFLYCFHCKLIFIDFFNVAVPAGCSPSCGPNAFCQEGVQLSTCVCNLGYQGDGYNCTGSYE